MSPGNLALSYRPAGVDGSAKEAAQDPAGTGRPRHILIHRQRQGAGSRAGLLPCVLPRDVEFAEEVNLPPHGALWSRLLPSHRGARSLPGALAEKIAVYETMSAE